jgi:hypothetical protein
VYVRVGPVGLLLEPRRSRYGALHRVREAIALLKDIRAALDRKVDRDELEARH